MEETKPKEPTIRTSEARRRAKLDRLRGEGVDPYPRSFGDRMKIDEIHAAHDPATMAEGKYDDTYYRIAGRLTKRRTHGNVIFFDIEDVTSRIEVYARLDDVGADAYRRIKELNIGDFVGIDGVLTVTKQKLLAICVSKCVLLAKALRDPPDFVNGLGDPETRYRRRELDMMVSRKSREVFVLRSAMLTEIRRYMNERDFVEIETPILQSLFGGATARPFETHHNALERKLYLRTATELYLKRAVIGGLENVYELGRIFRNEGISTRHNPEFTMLEFMLSGADYKQLMEFAEDLISQLVRHLCGTTEIEHHGGVIDFSTPWRRLPLREALLEETGVDITSCSREDMAECLDEINPDEDWAALVERMRTKFVEPNLTYPTFLTELPVRHWPTNRAVPGQPTLGEVWDGIAAGVEIVSGGTEIVDPVEQRERFLDQREMVDSTGDMEPHPLDEEFVLALEYGLPPAGGCGLGVDRLLTIVTDSKSLREVVLFPTMREV